MGYVYVEDTARLFPHGISYVSYVAHFGNKVNWTD